MKSILLLCLAFSLFSCQGFSQQNASKKNITYKVSKTDAEWRQELSPLQFYVMREEGTERAFSSPLDKVYEPGVYLCAACETPLFKSEAKFDSGSGWPSFDNFIEDNVLFSDGGNPYYGIEEHCATCGSHLGHVFNDGPRNTTGKRHCINGVALIFVPESD